MKQVNITIHPFSALLGMALLSMVWVSAAAMPLQGSSSDRDVSAIENVNDPHPRDYVRVQQGAPYTVPAGRVFVGRGMGFASNPGNVSFSLTMRINGQDVLSESGYYYSDSTRTWHDQALTEFPFGVTAQAGAAVSVNSSKVDGVLLGYLVDA
jgi:hypothetical protein